MLRRGRANPVIFIFILMILIGAAIGLFIFYRNVATVRILPWLSEEIGSKPVLTMASLNIEPGQVYIVNGEIQGWQIKKKDTQLYEKLVLSNVDISVNDVILPHIFDWYFDGKDDYLEGNIASSLKLSINEPYGTIAAKYVTYDTSRLVGQLNPHTGIAGFFFAYAITIYSPTTVQGYFQGLGHYGLVYLGNIEGMWISEVFGYNVIDANNTNVYMYINGEKQSLPNNGLYSYSDSRFGTDRTGITTFKIGWTGVGGVDEWLEGKVSYFLFWRNKLLNDNEVLDLENGIVYSTNLEIFADPIIYDGSLYRDLVQGINISAYGGVIRTIAEEPFLWLIKGLKTDNVVHFMYFPRGSIITVKDNGGNIISKFTIDGVKDYTLKLPQSSIPQASVEAFIPAFKVRVYGPLGATVEIVDESNVVVGSGKIAGSYVDIPLLEPVSGKIIIYADSDVQDILDILVDDSENILSVKILDNGVPIPGLLVRVADPSGVVIGYDITNASGVAAFELQQFYPELSIEVSGIWKGELIYVTEQITPPQDLPAEDSGYGSAGERDSLILLGLGALVIMVVILVLVGRRR